MSDSGKGPKINTDIKTKEKFGEWEWREKNFVDLTTAMSKTRVRMRPEIVLPRHLSERKTNSRKKH